MLPAVIGTVVAAIGKVAGSWLTVRQVKAEGKIAITHAKIASKVKRFEQIGEMDLAAMKGMMFSWKDEYILVLMSIPMIMSFIPGLADYATLGFKIVDTLPEWYTWSWMGIVTATFGLRTWNGWKK